MVSKSFKEAEIKPPNNDILHVKGELKEVLTYFKKCDNILSDIPVIKEQVHKISEQGSEFHTCLQRSIAQSNSLESHADSAISFLDALEDPNLDSDRISDGLKILFENTRQNKEETKQIKEKYESIKIKLAEINDEFHIREDNDRKKLQSLKEQEEDLEENLKTRKAWFYFFFIAGFIGFLQLSATSPYHQKDIRAFLVFTITIMVTLVAISLHFIMKTKADVRKIKREINDLEHMKNLITSSKKEINELAEIYIKLNPIIIQMGYFNIYWEMQYNKLGELTNSIDDLSDHQSRKLLMAPMKPRWEEVKRLCDNYIKTIRKTVTDVHNS